MYISSNNGVTNKYIAEYSYVEASRAIVIPQNGAVLSFDYRVNGNDNDNDGIRPDSITVKLYANNEDTKSTLELNESNNK